MKISERFGADYDLAPDQIWHPLEVVGSLACFGDKEIDAEEFQSRMNHYIDLPIATLSKGYLDWYKRLRSEASEELEALEKSYNISLLTESDLTTLLDEVRDSIDQSIAKLIEAQPVLDLLAIMRAVMSHTNGIELYDVQIIAGAQLYEKNILEMKTGEGKTFVLPLAAVLFGIRASLLNDLVSQYRVDANLPPTLPFDQCQVHVATANAYLARRDYQLMREFYNFFDLTVCFLDEGVINQRIISYYRYDVVYGTCHDLCHFYLNDLHLGPAQMPLLASQKYAILIDEIDQILLDEALVPHIISLKTGENRADVDLIYQAVKVAQRLNGTNSWTRMATETPVLEDDDPFQFLPREPEVRMSELGLEVAAFLVHQVAETQNSTTKDSAGEFGEILSNINPSNLGPTLVELLRCNGFLTEATPIAARVREFFADYLPLGLRLTGLRHPQVEVERNGERFSASLEDLALKFESVDEKGLIEMFLHCVSSEDEIDCFLETVRLLGGGGGDIDFHRAETLVEFWIRRIIENTAWKFPDGTSLPEALHWVSASDLPAMVQMLDDREHLSFENAKCFTVEGLSQWLIEDDGNWEVRPEVLSFMKDHDGFVDHCSAVLLEKEYVSPALMRDFVHVLAKLLTVRDAVAVYSALLDYQKRLEACEIEPDIKFNASSAIGKLIEQVRHSYATPHENENISSEIGKSLARLQELPEFQSLQEIFPLRELVERISFLEKELSEEPDLAAILDPIRELGDRAAGASNRTEQFQVQAASLHQVLRMFRELFGSNDPFLSSLSSIFQAVLGMTLRAMFGSELFKSFLPDGMGEAQSSSTAIDLGEILYEFILPYVFNPFSNVQDDLKWIGPEKFLDAIALIQSQSQNAPNYESEQGLLRRWDRPFFHISTLQEESQSNRLNYGADYILQHRLKRLQEKHLAGDTHLEFFTQMVQIAFNAVRHYSDKEQYVVEDIDQNMEPTKIVTDPYLGMKEFRKVSIVNNITGRVMLNNRWSRNLHSCVEAKENLNVIGESATFKQITPQSYFSMYKHISGLSGTTIVARQEFQNKYDLPVRAVPRNQPARRTRLPDKVSLTKQGAFKEMALDLVEIQAQSQAPCLVVLNSIESCTQFETVLRETIAKVRELIACLPDPQSEDIASFADCWNSAHEADIDLVYFEGWKELWELLEKDDGNFPDLLKHLIELEAIPIRDYHARVRDPVFLKSCEIVWRQGGLVEPSVNILDGRAESAADESELVKAAGEMSNILIATRVAGRGTDIKLVRQSGQEHPGLQMLIFGHQESARHDQQIFGRCGRQGDPGAFRFYNERITKSLKLSKDLEEHMEGIALVSKLGLEEIDEVISTVVMQMQKGHEMSSHLKRNFEKQIGDVTSHWQRIICRPESKWLLGGSPGAKSTLQAFGPEISVKHFTWIRAGWVNANWAIENLRVGECVWLAEAVSLLLLNGMNTHMVSSRLNEVIASVMILHDLNPPDSSQMDKLARQCAEVLDESKSENKDKFSTAFDFRQRIKDTVDGAFRSIGEEVGIIQGGFDAKKCLDKAMARTARAVDEEGKTGVFQTLAEKLVHSITQKALIDYNRYIETQKSRHNQILMADSMKSIKAFAAESKEMVCFELLWATLRTAAIFHIAARILEEHADQLASAVHSSSASQMAIFGMPLVRATDRVTHRALIRGLIHRYQLPMDAHTN